MIRVRVLQELQLLLEMVLVEIVKWKEQSFVMEQPSWAGDRLPVLSLDFLEVQAYLVIVNASITVLFVRAYKIRLQCVVMES